MGTRKVDKKEPCIVLLTFALAVKEIVREILRMSYERRCNTSFTVYRVGVGMFGSDHVRLRDLLQ